MLFSSYSFTNIPLDFCDFIIYIEYSTAEVGLHAQSL